MKKVKEKKPIDYRYVPDDVWEKALAEFLTSMNDIDQRLGLLERQLNRLVAFHCK